MVGTEWSFPLVSSAHLRHPHHARLRGGLFHFWGGGGENWFEQDFFLHCQCFLYCKGFAGNSQIFPPHPPPPQKSNGPPLKKLIDQLYCSSYIDWKCDSIWHGNFQNFKLENVAKWKLISPGNLRKYLRLQEYRLCKRLWRDREWFLKLFRSTIDDSQFYTKLNIKVCFSILDSYPMMWETSRHVEIPAV